MADRKDYFYGQIVQQNEMDAADDALESADQNFAVDAGLAAVSVHPNKGGIMTGLEASNPSGVDVRIESGAAYDDQGRRLYINSYKTVTLSATGNTEAAAGGTPTGGASTATSVGMKRWVSLFLVYDRDLKDPRTDDTGNQVFFERDESYHFHVSMGSQSANPTSYPPLQTGKLLLGDFRVTDSGVIDEISLDRRQVWLRARDSAGIPVTRADTVSPGTPNTDFPVRGLEEEEGVRETILKLLGMYNDHVRTDGKNADQHSGAGFVLTPYEWIEQTSIQGIVEEFVDDLARPGSPPGSGPTNGSDVIGCPEVAGAVDTLDQADLTTQLADIADVLQNRLVLDVTASDVNPGVQNINQGIIVTASGSADGVKGISSGGNKHGIRGDSSAFNGWGGGFYGFDGPLASSGMYAKGGNASADTATGGIAGSFQGGDAGTGDATGGRGVSAIGGAGSGANYGGAGVYGQGGTGVGNRGGHGIHGKGIGTTGYGVYGEGSVLGTPGVAGQGPNIDGVPGVVGGGGTGTTIGGGGVSGSGGPSVTLGGYGVTGVGGNGITNGDGGDGVYGQGGAGAGSGKGGAGVRGLGAGTGAGVEGRGAGATGSPVNWTGVYGQGAAGTAGTGVYGQGGSTNGPGGQFYGDGIAPGLRAYGGNSDGIGVDAHGDGDGAGIAAYGGSTGPGGTFAAGLTSNDAGIVSTGNGTGPGGYFSGGSNGNGLYATAVANNKVGVLGKGHSSGHGVWGQSGGDADSNGVYGTTTGSNNDSCGVKGNYNHTSEGNAFCAGVCGDGGENGYGVIARTNTSGQNKAPFRIVPCFSVPDTTDEDGAMYVYNDGLYIVLDGQGRNIIQV
jgi:hypothetical protein